MTWLGAILLGWALLLVAIVLAVVRHRDDPQDSADWEENIRLARYLVAKHPELLDGPRR